MSHFVLLTPLVILSSLNQAASEVFYITPKISDVCNMQPCLTLSQFAANSSNYIHSATTLVFLSGTHYLSKVNLTLSNVEDFMMKSESSTVQIKCANDSHIQISQSRCIHIINLQFIGCGGNQVKHVEEFLVNNTNFVGQENSGTALELTETTAQIVNSAFVSNRNGSYREFAIPLYYHRFHAFIGGAIIATKNTNINISRSKFKDNSADYGGAIFADNSIIYMTGNVSFNNNTVSGFGGGVLCTNRGVITINVSTFYNNLAGHIGGVLSSFSSTITIEASEFHGNIAAGGSVLTSLNSFIIKVASKFVSNNATGWSGGVLYFYKFSSNITIEGSEFDSNNGAVLYSESSTIIRVGDCNFTNNRSPVGAVIYAEDHTKI